MDDRNSWLKVGSTTVLIPLLLTIYFFSQADFVVGISVAIGVAVKQTVYSEYAEVAMTLHTLISSMMIQSLVMN